MSLVKVKEFDRISYKNIPYWVCMKKEEFDYLVNVIKKSNELQDVIKIEYDSRAGEYLKVQNYVGELEFKNGLKIQILPKIFFGNGEDETKKVFLQMLKGSKNLNEKEFAQASQAVGEMNLFETYIRMYLTEAKKLIKRGLRSEYEEKSSNLTSFRGKLQVAEHIRKNLVHQERFFVIYEEFTSNRIENRLIKTTIKKLEKITTNKKNKKDAKSLLLFLDGIKESINDKQDLTKVKIDRNLKDYEKIMKWTKAILLGKSFLAFSEEMEVRSILFAMEEVFENYVACQIKKYFGEEWEVSAQESSKYLFDHPLQFKLKPDIIMRKGKQTIILDTKWKKVQKKYIDFVGKARDDMYQMYAYAGRYEAEEIFLLYPKSKYSSLYLNNYDKFETTTYGKKTVIRLFFIDLANMDESMKKLNKEINK